MYLPIYNDRILLPLVLAPRLFVGFAYRALSSSTQGAYLPIRRRQYMVLQCRRTPAILAHFVSTPRRFHETIVMVLM